MTSSWCFRNRYVYHRSSASRLVKVVYLLVIQIHWTTDVWAWQLNWLEHSARIRRLGVRVPLRSKHLNLRHFHKNIRSWVEYQCCCPHIVKISSVNFTSKMYIHQYIVTHDSHTCHWTGPLEFKSHNSIKKCDAKTNNVIMKIHWRVWSATFLFSSGLILLLFCNSSVIHHFARFFVSWVAK